MSTNILNRLMMQDRQRRDKEIAEKIYENCVRDPDGHLVRGMVTKVHCARCGQSRWNDGTPCKNIGPNSKPCGQRYMALLNREDEGREG